MASIWQSIASLAAAGTMLVSGSLKMAAPQNDIDGLLFLANRQWRLSRYYIPETVQADVPGQLRSMRADAVQALEEMYAAAKEEEITLTSVSGYRSYDKQSSIYNAKVNSVGSKAKADDYVARPGASEHQLAMAMDVGQKGKVNLNAGFGSTAGGKWIREHCWEYGFIIRYEKGWEKITGYQYEPWHVRYVGKEHARRLHEQAMPLEDYLRIIREESLTAILVGK